MSNIPRNEQFRATQNAAIRYASVYGWHIFPLKSDAKEPATTNGFKNATNDDKQIENWFANPFNIGLSCGASGLIALDFDIHKPGYAGGDLLAKLRKDRPTLESVTQSGGPHLYYKQPKGIALGNSSGNLPKGVDVRGHGGYTVLPPSKLNPDLIDENKIGKKDKDGHIITREEVEAKRDLYRHRPGYRWVQGRGPGEIEIAELPMYVLEAILEFEPRQVTWRDEKDNDTPLRLTGIRGIGEDGTIWYSTDYGSGAIPRNQIVEITQSPTPSGGAPSKGKNTGERHYDNIIEEFNRANDIKEILQRHGYKLVWSTANDGRMIRPGGDSQSVRLFRDNDGILVSFHHNPNDALYRKDKGTIDPFEAIQSLDHNGDFNAAFEAAKRSLGKWKEIDHEAIKVARDYAECLRGKPNTAPTATSSAGTTAQSTPMIVINDRQLNDVLSDTIDAIKSYNSHNPTTPIMYNHAGSPTEIVSDENNNKLLKPVTKGAAKAKLSNVAQWFKAERKSITSVFPPDTITDAVISSDLSASIPAIDGIATAPTFAADGTLHDTPGYSDKTRLYYTGELQLGDTTPTDSNVSAAKSLILDELLFDFPFADEASKAHAVALILLPFVRPMIDGATPLHLIDAPTPGSGKGTLAKVCTIPGAGTIATMTEAGDDEEWRKRLTTSLMSGDAFISIDNIRRPLDSGSLASALTEPFWADRILGGNTQAKIKIRTIWLANGNNVISSEEIARRTVWIRLDPNLEKPWERTGFKHNPIEAWAKQNRAALATAAITLVRLWLDNGRQASTGYKGSYSEWSTVIGGILRCAGIPGFLDNDKLLFSSKVDASNSLKDFVDQWANKYGVAETGAKSLFLIASHLDSTANLVLQPGLDLLSDELGSGNEQSRRIRLGKFLSANIDKVVAGYKISKGSKINGEQFYILKKV